MKKHFLVLLSAIGALALVSCGGGNSSSSSMSSSSSSSASSSLSSSSTIAHPSISEEDAEAILKEMRLSFNFFYKECQDDPSSPAYGLIADLGYTTRASTASVGFGLASLPIGVEHGWITKEEGSERALGTMKTILSLDNVNGFYYHFLSMKTGARLDNCELSVIDSAIMIFGALVAGQYFGGEALTKSIEIYSKVNWMWYTGMNGSKRQFYMGYDSGGNGQFAGHWDYYAEQLMLYVLGAGAPNEEFRTDKNVYNGFTRAKGSYTGDDFIYSWFGSLFTYQFSHAFIDFRGTLDDNGVDWYKNSVNASIAARDWCINRKDDFATYGENSWGLTACYTKTGYSGLLGNYPRGWNSSDGGVNYTYIEGTVAPAGALGSMPFTPENSIAALKHYQSIEELNGKYGLIDSYDLVHSWYAYDEFVGIDKGISLLMLSNYYDSGLIWSLTDKISYVQDGLKAIGITKVS